MTEPSVKPIAMDMVVADSLLTVSRRPGTYGDTKPMFVEIVSSYRVSIEAAARRRANRKAVMRVFPLVMVMSGSFAAMVDFYAMGSMAVACVGALIYALVEVME